MGGHGGLNILPQKSWHVYRLDNKLKVDKDKQKFADLQRRQVEGDRADRLDQVLTRLKRGRGSCPVDLDNPRRRSAEDEELTSDRKRRRRRSFNDETKEGLPADRSITTGLDAGAGKSINLFEVEEREYKRRKEAHDATLKTLLHENNAKSAFSDEAKRIPWYAQAPVPRFEEEPQQHGNMKCKKRAAASIEVLREAKLRRDKRER